MSPTDEHALGFHDVDADAHTETLVACMDATAGWSATQRLRTWERQHLSLTEGERMLDVGCGRGDAALSLAVDLGPTGELVAVDSPTSPPPLDAS